MDYEEIDAAIDFLNDPESDLPTIFAVEEYYGITFD
jgi:hypothetical protein